MNVSARIKKEATIWSDFLRVRVGKTVIYKGSYYSNVSGINLEPTTSNDWVFIGYTSEVEISLYKNPSNDPNNRFLEVGDVTKRIVEGSVIEGIYNGPNTELKSSYTIYTEIEF